MTTYPNPILDADWPDPDAIRVGDDYWMIASSFNRAPGLPVLHSRDLVAWEHVANALPHVPPAAHYALPRHGSGVWAPSLRHHDGRFVIVYPDPDHGIFVLTAEDPRGPWSEPWCLLPGRGLIDPCPLWDEDGRTYLVHGWAKSRAGVKNRLTVVEVDADLRTVVGPARTVVDGDALPGFGTLEGPKLYQRDGWYWIFAPAGGVATGWQTAFRSRSVWGPYEHRVVLEQGSTDVNGPHQGAWVDTPDGTDWFLHFQDRGRFGRVVHLQPMRWDDDGWPRLGADLDGEPRDTTGAPRVGRGQPVLTHPTPTGAGEHAEPSRSDDFATPGLAPRWHWQANPQPGWHDAPGDGTLRLTAQPSPLGNLREQGAVLCQQIPGRPSTWTTTVTLTGDTEGTRAGVVVLGREYAWLGLERTPAGTAVVQRTWTPDDGETTVARHEVATDTVELRADVDADGVVTWSWRADPAGSGKDAEPTALAPGWQAVVGHWIGAEVGLFACAPAGTPATGADGADFGPVRVTVAGKDA
ncbi:glycoside hydrolase 43 family protein [Isoptericola dokdonensis]|jgi:beta-xylosidase|uniref:Beta-xylosidase n=1 Tax=Isoptericola dokdonensis DS-3 TaxID=1300344 RepID=A0A168FWP0_9MICO|nr:glycoside hydrolase 43 family protein [Isoptericola dokdonensis]ANC32630.1 Beta-xylosidase [Isoptericola dokdonensis DS-3]